jgi:hypothetical protein
MRWWRRFFSRLRRSGVRWEDDFERELCNHLELETEEQPDGLSKEDASNTATRMLGNRTLIQEDVREAAGRLWAERLKQDLRFGARVLHRSPAFTLVVIVSTRTNELNDIRCSNRGRSHIADSCRPAGHH